MTAVSSLWTTAFLVSIAALDIGVGLHIDGVRGVLTVLAGVACLGFAAVVAYRAEEVDQ